MTTAFVLVALGAAWRLLINFQLLDMPNAVPLSALALFAAARLPRRWAMLVPLAVLILSDLVIDSRHGYSFYWPTRLTTYAFFTLLAFSGRWVPEKVGLPGRVAFALAGSTLFFLASNFAVWLGGEGFGYPATFAGLLSTYTAGLPFFRNMLIADGLGTIALFGIDALLARRPPAVPATQRAPD